MEELIGGKIRQVNSEVEGGYPLAPTHMNQTFYNGHLYLVIGLMIVHKMQYFGEAKFEMSSTGVWGRLKN